MRFPLHVIRAFPESQHMDEREPPVRTLRARVTRSASPPSQRTHSATGVPRVHSAYSWGGGPRASEATGEGGRVATIDRCARRGGVGLFAVCAALTLPLVGVFGQSAAADTTLTLFEHDTQSTQIDLGEPGQGPGDEFLFAGDVFDRAGGTNIGHVAGQC